MADKPRSPRPPKQAAPRKVGGVDRRTIQILEDKGLLNQAGRKALKGAPGAAEERPANAGQERPARGAQQRPVSGGPSAGKRGRRGAAPEEEPIREERLQKVMAQAGVASRRHSEELIQAGRVTVNGKPVTELGTKVTPGRDIVEVDGRRLGRPETTIHILLNKPKGYVTTLFDPQGRPKVTDLLEGEIGERVYPVGRLDYDTEGLLLLTNDGELANALMHPAKEVKKTYIAKVRGVPGPAKIRELESGIELEDGVTAPAEVKMVDVKPPNAATLSVRIHEGKNRQVRRMFEAVGHEVIHLRRTTLGPLALKDLPVGQWRYLSSHEINDLRKAAGLRPLKVEAGESQGAGTVRTAPRGTARGKIRGNVRGNVRGAGRDVAPGGRGFRVAEPEPAQLGEAEEFEGRQGAPRLPGPKPAGLRPAGLRPVGFRPAGPGQKPAGPRPAGLRPAGDGPRREGSGFRSGDGPRREGSGFRGGDGPRREGSGFRSGDGPRREGSGFRSGGGPRREGGGFRSGDGPRREGSGFRSGEGARREGGFRSGDGPRREGDGPRREGGGPRREGGGPRREGGGPRGGGAGGFRKNRSPK